MVEQSLSLHHTASSNLPLVKSNLNNRLPVYFLPFSSSERLNPFDYINSLLPLPYLIGDGTIQIKLQERNHGYVTKRTLDLIQVP